MSHESALEISTKLTDETGATRPRFLVFAIPVDLEMGITGATVGTKSIVEQISGKCDVTWIKLKNPGLPGAGRPGNFIKALRIIKTILSSVKSIAKLVWHGVFGKKVDYVYFVPSSSLLGTWRDLIVTLAANLLFSKAKLVLHVHNGNYFQSGNTIQQYIRTLVANQADIIFVLSQRLLPAPNHAKFAFTNKVCVLPNTIDAALIPPVEDVIRKRNKFDEPISVLFFSNFLEDKGYWTLLESGALLVARGLSTRFRFTFHGKWLFDQERDAFTKRAKEISESGLEIRVGDMIRNRRDAQMLYATHDVFCLPTSYDAEAQPLSVLEAMANACVIVATNYRSIPDMVVDRRNGILIPSRDPALLADALQALTELDLTEMQVESRNIFDEHFSRERIKQSLYQSLGL